MSMFSLTALAFPILA